MDLAQLARTRWDAIVVGTGMGGATIGYALARAGWSVLFCEKGRSTLPGTDALRGDYAERYFTGNRMGPEQLAALRRGGRQGEAIFDLSGAKARRFVPFVGSGTGGSSALYGMALERFFPADFVPRRHHQNATDSTLPDHWPISFRDLVPFYEVAERLYGVRGTRDPLKSTDDGWPISLAPPFSPSTREVYDLLESKGMHPYHLPMACAYVPNCQGCQGYLCAYSCKRDSASVCLMPALDEHGATLADDCEVLRLESSGSRVTNVLCRRRGIEARLSGDIVILAGGALATPTLLFRSASGDWPRGLANTSGALGKNLMRHFVDLYAVFPRRRDAGTGNVKELGCNDFYVTKDGKYGSLQSFGRLPPAAMLLDDIEQDVRHHIGGWAAYVTRMAKPIITPLLARFLSRPLILATILEDLPYAHNRVTAASAVEESRIEIRYRIDELARQRIRDFRGMVGRALNPHRFLLIKQAESNQRLAHVCGTCRFGDDAQSSVLDANNKAHDLENLYIVDGSFLPSSGGTNPALTIAANALRVADYLIAARNRAEIRV
jgi:choline dehydrogenase-like flavoprotein